MFILKRIKGTLFSVSEVFAAFFPFLKMRYIFAILSFSLFANLFCFLIIFFFLSSSEFPIALHYNIYYGVDYVGRWYMLFLCPLTGLLFIAANVFFMKLFESQDKIIPYILSFLSAMIQIILLINIILLIDINS